MWPELWEILQEHTKCDMRESMYSWGNKQNSSYEMGFQNSVF